MSDDAITTTAPSPESENLNCNTKRTVHVVGIGASAGGLEALERLFENMPLETGMAFVVVQHLSPDFKSVMDELLARKTRIPIHRVEEGMEVEPNAIYLIPPKKDMIISNGRLLLTDKDPKQLLTLPIDHFFRSLAHDCGDCAIAIVLSGTGSDGSRGIRDINEAGGLVIVQTPETAKFDGMPNSARQTGAADLFLAPQDMPLALLQYIKHPLGVECATSAEDDTLTEEGVVFRLLREAYGIDFSHYKPSTVGRRIDRRLLLNRSFDLDDYVKRLRHDGDELNALYKDLLIGVTRFFRDADAYELLATSVLPPLLAELSRDDEFRVWSAGCATGEEAYSLAMVVDECARKLNQPINIKIFATDVHRTSLDYASSGLYTEAQVSDISPERLDRYFMRKGDGYHIKQELRQMVVFAPHNLIRDAPFTKMDLISCRNLLIYLQPPVQKKIISLFHFALKTGGILFLGPSESPGELSDEFDLVHAHWKMYRKRRDIRLPTDLRLPLSAGNVRAMSSGFVGRSNEGAMPDQRLLGTYDVLLDKFMPPSLLINERRELVESFAGANRFLHLKERRLSMDVLDLVEANLKTVLSGALPRVVRDKSVVAYKGVRVKTAEGERLIDITALPILCQRTSALHVLVTLKDQEGGPAPTAPSANLDMGNATQEQLHALETDLRYTKENLQATIEELETSNEELQATNEELVASNEELQSTNEELHSVNEELYTVNAEYQKKITELTELTADMDNLLESTQVHTLFLDRKLCIRKFTPRIADTFHLLPQDIGRRISSFTHNINHATLLDELDRVMETGQPLEEQVQDHRGNWFLMRILPYTAKGVIDGVVLTLVDLAPVKRAEAETRAKDRQLSAILKNSPQLVFLKDLDGRYTVIGDSFRFVARCDPIGKRAHDVFPKEIADVEAEVDRRVMNEKAVVEDEITIQHPDGPHTYLSVNFPFTDESGRITGLAGFKTDVTRLKLAEKQAREAVEQRDRFLAMLSHELRNPLGAIVNAVTVLDRISAEDGHQREAREVILRQSEQMRRLLDDLLEVSRITQNKIQIHQRVLRLEHLVKEAIGVVQSAINQGQLTFQAVVPDGPITVFGDPVRLQQMLVNLLTNAVKYTPAGGSVRLELQRDGEQAIIRVSDTGVGIRAEMLDKVFEPFVQADETLARSKGGIGVGLTLARSIIELHGGVIQAHSDGPGRGSEFVVQLPLTQVGDVVIDPGADGSQPGKTRVVVVEDNEDSRRMLETLLKLEGHEVRAASDGKEGLETIMAFRPAVALIDIGLPEMNGYALARKIRATLGVNSVYLVALTGYGRAEDRQSVLDAGFDEHLVKPLKRGDLSRVLNFVRK